MEADFKNLLDTLFKDTQAALRAYYALKAIHKAGSRNAKIRQRLNESSDFWNIVMYSLQSTYFIALGRIFDSKSPNNVHKFLKFCEDHIAVFSREALKERCKNRFADKRELEVYVQNAYIPTERDFHKIGRLLRNRRKKYQRHYETIRNKIYAHSELTSKVDIDQAFKNIKVGELEDILLFLQRLNSAIRMLFINGHKPALTRQRLPWKRGIINDTNKLLKILSKIQLSKSKGRVRRS